MNKTPVKEKKDEEAEKNEINRRFIHKLSY